MSSSPAKPELCKPRFPPTVEAADTGVAEHTAQLVCVDKHFVLEVGRRSLGLAGKTTQPDGDLHSRTS